MSPLRYDDDSLFGAARNSDPATAKDAAKSMTAPILSEQRREILQIVDRGIKSGSTAYDVALWTQHRIQQNVAIRRLLDLEDLGFVYRTGETRPGSSSRLCHVYRCTPDGREALS